MSTSIRSTPQSLRALMLRAIDYAGLFPPASLDMSASLSNYAAYLQHPQHWALGHFVLPMSRLEEFCRVHEQVFADRMDAPVAPWPVSVVLSANLVAELAAIQTFQSTCKCAVIDSIEARISQSQEIESIRMHLPPDAQIFFEIAPGRASELLPSIARGGFCAKLRMGGVVPEAVPCPETIAEFLLRCAELGVRLKATAGLHHPLRRFAPLTYAPNAPKAKMHGFLNFFAAAALAWGAKKESLRMSPDLTALLTDCLSDCDPAHWQFTDEALTYSGAAELRVEMEEIAEMRSKFVLSFGSCSFEEPVEGLREMGLL